MSFFQKAPPPGYEVAPAETAWDKFRYAVGGRKNFRKKAEDPTAGGLAIPFKYDLEPIKDNSNTDFLRPPSWHREQKRLAALKAAETAAPAPAPVAPAPVVDVPRQIDATGQVVDRYSRNPQTSSIPPRPTDNDMRRGIDYIADRRR
jgi:hypothetical protein